MHTEDGFRARLSAAIPVDTDTVFQARRFLDDIEAGQTAIDEYSDWQTVYVDYSGQLQKAQGLD